MWSKSTFCMVRAAAPFTPDKYTSLIRMWSQGCLQKCSTIRSIGTTYGLCLGTIDSTLELFTRSPSTLLPSPLPLFVAPPHPHHCVGYEWSPANSLQGREGSTGGTAQFGWYPPLFGRNCHTDQTSYGQGY